MMWLWTLVLVLMTVVNIGCGETEAPWWNTALYYNILVDSFKDSDGDGLGDLKGTQNQLSYVRALGANAVILSPISATNTDCTKPGIIDLIEIDQRYGNLDIFTGVLAKAKTLELKLVVTLPLQTVSAASAWFTSSVDRVAGFEDRFIWQDGKLDDPPPAEDGIDWIWHDTRNAYWGASNNEALLNLCSESVVAALSAAQCAWLRRGVSGVLLRPDYPRNHSCGVKLLKKMAADAMSCSRAANLDTPVILVESSLKPEMAADYYTEGGVGANSILSNVLTKSARTQAADTAMGFYSVMLTTPQDMTPTWQTSSSNESRIATRYGSDMVDSINLLALILPGAAVIRQGDELGAADAILEWATSTTCWPSRGVPSSAPFPWDESSNAGFTGGEPWLPLAPNYRYANAKTEFSNDLSHLGVVRNAAAMRKSPASGPHVEIKRLNGALAILRWGQIGSLLVVSNLARDQTEALLSRIPGIPLEMTVAASSGGSTFSIGSHVKIDRPLKLAPAETVLLAGGPRHCGPGAVDKITSKLTDGWEKLNKFFNNM